MYSKKEFHLQDGGLIQKWEKEDTIKTKKVKIYPTIEQKKVIKRWFGTYRYVYNQFLNYTKNNEDNKEWLNNYKMRDKFVTYKYSNNTINPFFENKEWMKETPKEIRAEAIRSCIS
jgi:hypothetical protein